MDAPIKPGQVGLTQHGDGVSEGRVDRRQLQVSQAAKLSDLSEEYVWFTLGLMYKYVRLMGRDPWGDFIDESGRDETYQMTVRFDKPIFTGMEVGGDQDWNHVLWAMPKEDWIEYCQWMGRLSFLDRDQQMVTRLRTQELEIFDPIVLDRAAVLTDVPPVVNVTVFALDTNQGCVFISPSPSPAQVPHVVVTNQVLRQTQAWAKAILTNHPDPYWFASSSERVDPVAELAARVKAVREGQDP